MNEPLDPFPPVTVLVTEGRWDAVDLTTDRNFMLTQKLKEIGGIAASVPPGTYHFNMIESEDGTVIFTLDPA